MGRNINKMMSLDNNMEKEAGFRGGYLQSTTDQVDVHGVQRSTNSRQMGPITCYKCGQKGHIASGCRIRTDFQRRPLNFKKSTPGDEELT